MFAHPLAAIDLLFLAIKKASEVMDQHQLTGWRKCSQRSLDIHNAMAEPRHALNLSY